MWHWTVLLEPLIVQYVASSALFAKQTRTFNADVSWCLNYSKVLCFSSFLLILIQSRLIWNLQSPVAFYDNSFLVLEHKRIAFTVYSITVLRWPEGLWVNCSIIQLGWSNGDASRKFKVCKQLDIFCNMPERMEIEYENTLISQISKRVHFRVFLFLNQLSVFEQYAFTSSGFFLKKKKQQWRVQIEA